jgi:hypothetical protein
VITIRRKAMNRMEKNIRNPRFSPAEPVFNRGYEKSPTQEPVWFRKTLKPASCDFIVEWQMNEPSSTNRKVS